MLSKPIRKHMFWLFMYGCILHLAYSMTALLLSMFSHFNPVRSSTTKIRQIRIQWRQIGIRRRQAGTQWRQTGTPSRQGMTLIRRDLI